MGLIWPEDAHDDKAALRARLAFAEQEVRTLYARIVTAEQEAVYARDAWGFAMDRIRALQCQRQESDDRLTKFGKRPAKHCVSTQLVGYLDMDARIMSVEVDEIKKDVEKERNISSQMTIKHARMEK
ncbi:hypothetical protein Tco_1015734 [Tanacetum coccineum]|uniref:Uncharacterized protein n=1 Tax=Tanacetum coccineum TaxID=301880 RepID=A0ABQ5FM85_9ASTR